MAMSPPVKEGEFELLSEGVHQGVLVGNWSIGLQETNFKDEQGFNKMVYQIIFAWELTKKRKDGNPFVVYKTFTNSLHKKSGLRKDLNSLGIKITEHDERVGFDYDQLIGKNCLITIAHKDVGENTYANIVGISALPDVMQPVQATRKYAMPAWVEKKIKLENKVIQDAAKNPVSQARAEASDPDMERIPF